MNKFCLFLFSTIVQLIISLEPMYVKSCRDPIIQNHSSKYKHSYCDHACSNFLNVTTSKQHIECSNEGYCLCHCSDKVPSSYDPVFCPSTKEHVNADSDLDNCKGVCNTICTEGVGTICSESDTSLASSGIYVKICTCSCPRNDCSFNLITTSTSTPAPKTTPSTTTISTSTPAPTTTSSTTTISAVFTTTTPRITSTPVPVSTTLATTLTTQIPSTISTTPTTSTIITTSTSRPVTSITPFKILYNLISSYVCFEYENGSKILRTAVTLNIIIFKLITVIFYEFTVLASLIALVLG